MNNSANDTRVKSIPEYGIWLHMKQRCYNSRSPAYVNYGGRGIKVCDRWLKSFRSFYEDVGPRPSPKLSIDRIDNDGNYEPGNVRWATREQQFKNRRVTRFLTYNNEKKSFKEWSDFTGIKLKTIAERLKAGWSVEKTLTTPPMPTKAVNGYCARGLHKMTPENTRDIRSKPGRVYRGCRECGRIRDKDRYHRLQSPTAQQSKKEKPNE